MFFSKISYVTILLGSLSSFSLLANTLSPWQDIETTVSGQQRSLAAKNVSASHGRQLTADFAALYSSLIATDDPVQITLPLPDGTQAVYRLTLDSIMAEDLATKYPEIRTYRGVDIDNASNRGRFDITPLGFHAMVTHQGEWLLLDPELQGNTHRYLSYKGKNAIPLSNHPGDTYYDYFSSDVNYNLAQKTLAQITSSGSTLRTYRTAISATGEYTQFFGGTKLNALSAITTSLNRVNEVFSRDLAVRLVLASNTDELIFTNPATDPFTNNDADSDIASNMDLVVDTLGLSAFDIGHVLTTTGSGLAYVGVVCSSDRDQDGGYYKAGGVSGYYQPNSDAFYIGLLAHELGHQFGADHSFNGQSGYCSGSSRNADTAWEPGSGSTIMSYAGICDDENLQATSSDFFHGGSIRQIQSYLNSTSCAATSSLSNTAPTASAGINYTIPANTPFVLEGAASDIDNDTLQYIWEEMDTGNASYSPATMIDDGTRPIFRSYELSSSPDRYLPKLDDILDGTTSLGESYPTTNRDLDFRLTVRDGNGGVAYDDMRVTVTTSSGPFSVTEPTLNEQWFTGDTVTVSWDVANTTSSPVSCPAVDIILSTDGGSNFNRTLLAGTTNNGSQSFVMPNFTATSARIMVRCSDNVFFAVNSGTFSIIAGTGTSTTTEDTDPYIAPEVTPSSGGGGSLPPSLLLLLAIAGIMSMSGCKPKLSQANDSHSDSSPITSEDSRESSVMINPQSDPVQDADTAISQRDYRFFVVPGREPTIPGIEQKIVPALLSQYGAKQLAVSDAIKNPDQAILRKSIIEYARVYNKHLANYLQIIPASK